MSLSDTHSYNILAFLNVTLVWPTKNSLGKYTAETESKHGRPDNIHSKCEINMNWIKFKIRVQCEFSVNVIKLDIYLEK